MFDLCLATIFISLASGKNTAVLLLSQSIMSSLLPALENIQQQQLGELIPNFSLPSAGGSVGRGCSPQSIQPQLLKWPLRG